MQEDGSMMRQEIELKRLKEARIPIGPAKV